jgi:molecular chaperone GrpE
MSESETPGFTGDASASRPSATLTPAEIDAVLGDFRSWLTRLATAPANSVDLPRESVDLHTLVAHFTSLRQEVNLQTRAVRTQQEQSAETLRRYSEAVTALESASAQVADARQRQAQETVNPLLKGMIEVADAQALAAKELARVLTRLDEALGSADQRAATKQLDRRPRVPFLARLFGAGHVLAAQQRFHDWLESRVQSVEVATMHDAALIRGRVEAAALGLDMGLQRIERTMLQHGLEPIVVEGHPFNPEQMEVIEVVANSGLPTGEVVEEVKRGYLWNGQVFRFAQVRVAK